MKTKLIFVRHGESLGNAVRVMLGHTDLDLSEKGYMQAAATAEALADEKIDYVYSSDLLRAMNTARPHAERRNITVIPSRELREVDIGEWEGRSVEEIIASSGEVFERDWHLGFGTFTFPGGEAVARAGERFMSEVERIAERHAGSTVLIAAHAAVIRSFWARAVGIAPEKIVGTLEFPSNASYSVMEYVEGSFTPVSYSNDAHLLNIGITKVNT
ncbi:MAG: histidine phosphatase family protein [Clostridia bacterium]|nr:histidine phosphatase family protein [Clostridia bacterium]